MATLDAVTVDLQGPRRLKYTMAAYKRLRGHGINLLSPTPEEQARTVDAYTATTILWCGLVDEDRAAFPTVDALDAAVTLADLPRLIDAIERALAASNTPELPPDPLAGTATATPPTA